MPRRVVEDADPYGRFIGGVYVYGGAPGTPTPANGYRGAEYPAF